ncbi:MAG: PTS sugar transporter subunit IIC [Clostridia bacterium]|nr:PTS sugar transporter subunit IIC [Clostridia bacterium]
MQGLGPSAKGFDVENTTKKRGVRAFLDKRGVTLSPKVYFVDAMGAMALGLFATLLIGTIFGTVAGYIPEGNIAREFFDNLTTYSKGATGIVLGIAIAYALKAPPLVMFSAGVVGMCSYALPFEYLEKVITAGPAGAFLATLVAVEVGKLVSKTTKVDIIVTPAVTIASGVALSMLICPAVSVAMYWVGEFVAYATEMLPFLMGIIIAVVVGMILTLPISSAAICAMIGISGIAGGAAVAGCCAQMVGFAVISFRENKWSGVIAQGLGTSMLQMGNIVKNPKIWIPATLASAITGPISTCVFALECTGVSAGMGTCGLVGPLGVFADMGFNTTSVIGVLLVCIVLPAVLSLVFSEIMRRIGWIKEDDLKLEL